MGAGEMEMTLQERVLMIDAVERSQASQMRAVEGWMMDMLSIDESDAVYQSFRFKTTLGLEIGSLVVGGYEAVSLPLDQGLENLTDEGVVITENSLHALKKMAQKN